MAPANFPIPAKTIFYGNILLVVCCIFYLIWWLLAFRPVNPVSGTGWLLLPAAIAGLASVICITRGISAFGARDVLIPSKVILFGGLAAFVILLAVTTLVFHRPVTTELFLIVGWCTMILSEVNALYGVDLFSRNAAVTLMVVILAAVVVSLVCYVLYYQLDARVGYYDGMVPLLMVACVTAAISVCMLVYSHK
ncbi:MAG: hypothetical protein FWF33_01030 [Clostridiales bacterium]|nr:hypothetical protein [Clostridiales bacterium]